MAGAVWVTENSFQEERKCFEIFLTCTLNLSTESICWMSTMTFSVLFKEHHKKMTTKNELSTAQDNSSSYRKNSNTTDTSAGWEDSKSRNRSEKQVRIWFQNRRRKWKNENKIVEEALKKAEIRERVRRRSAQDPNGLGSLTMINNMNNYQNSFSEVNSMQQVRRNYGFPSPIQSYNGGLKDRPRTLCSQRPFQHFWF